MDQSAFGAIFVSADYSEDNAMGLSAYCMIRMADGTEQRAENLDVGDVVWNPDNGTGAALTRVDGSPGVGMVAIGTRGGKTVHLTGDQTVYVDTGEARAEAVRAGSRLQTADGFDECVDNEALPGDFKVYDLRGEGLRRVLANGVVVGI